jgi:hypothetical protein
MQNIYAGRTFSSDDMALSGQNERSGMVAVSHEFSTAVIAYSALYSWFLRSIDDSKARPESDARIIQQGMRAEFNRVIDTFKDLGIVTLQGTWLTEVPDRRHRLALELFSRTAEQWALAHEFGHHLVRDMSTRRDKDIDALFGAILSRSTVGHDLANLPRLQRCEVEADLLATLLLAGHFSANDRPTTALSHLAVASGAIALITVAHLNDEWTCSRTDTHPGCLDRLRFLMTIMCELYGTRSVDPGNVLDGSHITVSRTAGAVTALAHWLEDADGTAQLIAELRAIRSTRLSDAGVLMAHYWTHFGLIGEEYAENQLHKRA